MKILLSAIILMLSTVTSSGKGECSNCIIYNGYLKGDMMTWRSGMDEMRETFRKDPSSSNLYSLAEARYGYIGYLLGEGRKAEARPLVDQFEQDIEMLAAYPHLMAEVEAFRVALLGFRMGLNPARAMSLGSKALRQLEKAMETGGENPAVWIEKANSEAHMPAFVGGSKTKAAESFRQAIRLFEMEPESLECNWRYLNTFVLLGKLLEQTGDYKGACDAYRKALQAEPAFQWVRGELLPAAEMKMR